MYAIIQAEEKLTAVRAEARGSCDFETGICQCFPGFTGVACRRTTCPKSCSGHGVCVNDDILNYHAAGNTNLLADNIDINTWETCGHLTSFRVANAMVVGVTTIAVCDNVHKVMTQRRSVQMSWVTTSNMLSVPTCLLPRKPISKFDLQTARAIVLRDHALKSSYLMI